MEAVLQVGHDRRGDNILLIVLDTTRARELALGWDAATLAPALRDIGASGTVWRHAISPAIWTPPAHVSLLSGLMPSTHGAVGQRSLRQRGWAREIEGVRHRWLPLLLHGRGYDTFGISANPYVSPGMGFDLGFRRWHRVKPPFARQRWSSRTSSRRLRRLERSLRLASSAFVATDHGAERSMRILQGELRAARPGTPFFGLLNLMEAHSPYCSPASSDLPLPLRLRGTRLLGAEFKAQRNRFNRREWDGSAAWHQVVRAFYFAAIGYLDRLAARIVTMVQEAGASADTLLLFVGDHGEHLGEHHLSGHTMSLHEEVLHVPALAVGPVEPEIVAEPTSTLALWRTALQHSGMVVDEPIEEPSGEFESMRLAHPSFSGRSELPLVASEGAALYADGTKLWAESDGAERWFLLDQTRERPVSEDAVAPQTRVRLRGRRDAWLGRVSGRGAPAQVVQDISPEEALQVEEHLRDLGYID